MNIWEQCNERRELRKQGKIRKPVARPRADLWAGQMHFAEPLPRPRKKPKKPVNPFLMQAPRTLQ